MLGKIIGYSLLIILLSLGIMCSLGLIVRLVFKAKKKKLIIF